MIRLSKINNIKLNFGESQNIEEQKLGSFKDSFLIHFLGEKTPNIIYWKSWTESYFSVSFNF